MTFEKCSTCKNSFTTGKDRLYCKESLADRDDCGRYETTRKINLDDFVLYLETRVPYFKGRHKGVLTLFKRILEEYYDEFGHTGD